MVTVLVILLLTSIGIFAARNITRVDQAVGFSRQSGQTLAVAELGTTSALSQIALYGADYYALKMDDPSHQCRANSGFMALPTTCFRLGSTEVLNTTTSNGGETPFEPPVAGSETGSFGPLTSNTGYFSVEMTEKYKTTFPVPGQRAGDASYVSVTMTTTGHVRPVNPGPDECLNTAISASKKMMRAHTIVGPLLSQQSQ